MNAHVKNFKLNCWKFAIFFFIEICVILRLININRIEQNIICTLIVHILTIIALSKCKLIIFAENKPQWTNYLNSFRSF